MSGRAGGGGAGGGRAGGQSQIPCLANDSSGDVGNQGCGTWSRGRFGIVLGPFWDRFGIVSVSFWNCFGVVLGSFRIRFGVDFEER